MGRRAVLVAVLVVAAAVVLLLRNHTGRPDQGPWTLIVDVRDPAGTSVAANVWVTNEHDDLIEMVEGQAREDLRFEVSGKVALRVVAEGLAPRFLDGLVAPSGTEKYVTLMLDRGVSISGEILEPEGVRLRGWRLDVCAVPLDPPWSSVHGKGWAFDSSGPWARYADEIHADWRFEIPNLAPGRYRVEAFCDPQDYGPRDAPIVDAGTTGVEIQLVELARLKLRFVDRTTHAPPPLAWFEATKEGETDPWWSGTTLGEAKAARFFDVTSLALQPGQTVTVRVGADGYLPHEPISAVAGAPGEETEVVCELVPDPGVWAELDLVLLDEEGLPVVNAEVWRELTHAVSREEGHYRLRVPAGVWWIHAEPEWDMVTRLLAFWLPHEEEIRFERGEHVQREWTVKRGGLILVRGEVEQPPRIVADGKRTVMSKRSLSKRGGREWIEPVPAGTYRVEAWCGGRLAGTEVVVRAGEVTVVTFPLNR